MNIYQKLVEVRKSVPYLKKEAKGEQYNYTGSSQVLYSLRAKMDEMGLLLIPRITGKEVAGDTIEWTDKYNKLKHTTTYFTELTMEFTWVNADKPEETITCPWYGQGVDIAGEKGVGKALTYAEKYFLLKFFNIATDKDDPDAFQAKYDDEPKQQGQPPQGKTDEPKSIKPTLKAKWVTCGGEEKAFDAWYHQQLDKKYTEKQMEAYLTKTLMAKNKEKQGA